MSNDDAIAATDLRKLVRQVNATIQCMESGMNMIPLKPEEQKVNQGYEIGDFVITPRFPKTDFQG